jgi:threonine/homoserine/homoserine lactone efflux protein
MLAYLIQGIAYGFTAAIQPGPFQTYVISQTLTRGWRKTLPSAAAPLLSDGPIIILALVILSQITEWFQRFLYIISGLFILYLAYNAYITWRNFDERGVVIDSSVKQGVVRAAMINALNPGPYIYWGLVTGPILLAGWRESPVKGLGFLFSFYATLILSLSGIIVVFGTARLLGPKVNRILLLISAITLVCLGLYQLWLGLYPAPRKALFFLGLSPRSGAGRKGM